MVEGAGDALGSLGGGAEDEPLDGEAFLAGGGENEGALFFGHHDGDGGVVFHRRGKLVGGWCRLAVGHDALDELLLCVGYGVRLAFGQPVVDAREAYSALFSELSSAHACRPFEPVFYFVSCCHGCILPWMGGARKAYYNNL